VHVPADGCSRIGIRLSGAAIQAEIVAVFSNKAATVDLTPDLT